MLLHFFLPSFARPGSVRRGGSTRLHAHPSPAAAAAAVDSCCESSPAGGPMCCWVTSSWHPDRHMLCHGVSANPPAHRLTPQVSIDSARPSTLPPPNLSRVGAEGGAPELEK